MNEPLFRSEAVAAIDSADRLDEAITIVSARSALALAAILVLVAIGVLWACLGTIPVTVEGRGVLVTGNGTAHISAIADGTIERVSIAVGDSVHRGEPIVRERTQYGVLALRAPIAGTVIEITRQGSGFVHGGDVVASVAPPGPMDAIIFVPVASERHVEVGMDASVVPADVPQLGGRGVRAQVVSVAPYPASADRIRNALQDDALAAQFSPEVAVREVRLELQQEGPGEALAGGTPCTATIRVHEMHPIELLFARSQ
jgi:HlyD family secretion protein